MLTQSASKARGANAQKEGHVSEEVLIIRCAREINDLRLMPSALNHADFMYGFWRANATNMLAGTSVLR